MRRQTLKYRLTIAAAANDYRPSLIFDGSIPFPNSPGLFHGFSERFSGSSVAQPVIPKAIAARTIAANKLRKSLLIIDRSILIAQDLVAFHHFAASPTGHDVSDSTMIFDIGNFQLRNQTPATIHQKLTALQ